MRKTATFLVLLGITWATQSASAKEYVNCHTPDDTMIGFHSEESRADISATRCSFGNDQSIYILRIGDDRFDWISPAEIGSRVYFEIYRARTADYLLVSFGYDSDDGNGNFFNYLVYRTGLVAPVTSGKSQNRPLLKDVFPEAFSADE